MFSTLRKAVSAFRKEFSKPSAKESFALPSAADSPARTKISFPIVTGKKEVEPYERKEAVKQSKYLCGSLGFFSALIRRLPRYMTPITPVPLTGDAEYDALLRTEWNDYTTSPLRCDFQGRQSFPRITKTMIVNFLRSGEVFQTNEANELGPQIRLLDESLFGDIPSDWKHTDGEQWVDGVLFGVDGRIRGYCYKELDGTKVFMDRQNVNHILDVDRIDQPRGIPWMAAGLHGSIDIMDLITLEKASAKLHSALAVAVTNKSGTQDEGFSQMLAEKLKMGESNSAVDAATAIAQAKDEINGVMVKYLEKDEDIKLLSSERPSQAFAGFIDFLVRDVAWSLGISPEFVWQVSGLNGNNMRFVMADAQNFFDDIISIFVDGCIRDIYLKVIGAAIDAKRIPFNPNWTRVDFVGPPKLTIDNGKDAQTDLLRLQNGMLTYEDYFRARNKDPDEQLRKGVQWCRKMLDECEKENVPSALYIRTIGGANNSPDSANQAAGGSKDNPRNTKQEDPADPEDPAEDDTEDPPTD